MLSVACELATSHGPASAQRAICAVRAEYGRDALPAGLLKRIAAAGAWSDFGAKMAPEALAEAVPSDADVAEAPPRQHRRRKSASWVASWVGGGSSGGASAAAAATSAQEGPATPPARAASGRAPAAPRTFEAQPSFAYIDADAALAAHGAPADAAHRAWCSSFFHRVDALCVKRTSGARPADAASGGGVGPWGRLGALKRKNTYWWSAKGGSADAVERRNTSFL
jgi:hypothetical protein